MRNRQLLLIVILFSLSFFSCKKTEPITGVNSTQPIIPLPPVAGVTPGDGLYYSVKTRSNTLSSTWTTYTAKTIEHLAGFTYSNDPELSNYGGWKVNQSAATGYFRVEKKNNRWWIIDPDGYPFIHKAVAVFRPGTSTLQKSYLATKYGTNAAWANQETQFLRTNGFNGTGAWSDVDLIRASEKPLVYTVIVNPMASYRAVHIKRYGGTYDVAGWQGYHYDLVMVFDPDFQTYVESSIKPIAAYATDKNLLGYFTDNELPWVNDALDRHIKYLPTTDPGYIAAKAWLDNRKGKDAGLADITADDRLAFTGYYFETYAKKVADAVRKYDPNHMYLGCRFNQSGEELNNPEIFKAAGKYMDIVSINHYRKWEPDMTIMANWASWSGKPFLITEWYTKGEDSGLPNQSGAGWNVPTQLDRGYFYQNFCIQLLKSKACVGWNWFTYQDNDPLDLTTDASNRDSNKGIVASNYTPYSPLMNNIKTLNTHVYELTQFLDK